ncbi:MAG: chlorite dismutase family protein [Armatimonadota bacterium]|nr:chlorite dismutase family protein [Armatimonadota bacterium]MDR7449778.1 chlorite dismutase family protein [Armatimonadota bacterium]MDR7458415.1 chlorite dismutase family protein [Armatimonadota bacterium]MDR7478783.1 chlorite dismutase family protein [Armatimonadota bacterium]MDR7488241.1 chlorite dismutase family protein [Armatimonadota bacterium]
MSGRGEAPDTATAADRTDATEPGPARRVVQVLALRVDPAWRRLPEAQRDEDLARFREAAAAAAGRVLTHTYSMVGLRADCDLLFWRLAASLEDLEETAALLLRSGLGRWCRVAHSLIGLLRPSVYVKHPTVQEQALVDGRRSRYLVVYPFVKSAEWYLTPRETRQRIMAEHIRVGHAYPMVRQLLAYSFGVDDQEFIVAYETDDLAAFQELVMALRETESRRATVRDTPILTGVHRPLEDALRLLG